MKQIPRTKQINTILEKIDSQFPHEMGVTLETYISKLEGNQKVVTLKDKVVWDVDNPPIWSHARHKEREQHRRERTERNRNNYQSAKPL